MKLEEMLKKYRKENDISQREFARRCGLSNSLISILEMGVNPQTGKENVPDLETCRRLANGMGISVHQLFSQVEMSVKLGKYNPSDHDDDYLESSVPENLTREDADRLEALHQDPRLLMLFDRSRKMSDEDKEKMLQIAGVILGELGRE